MQGIFFVCVLWLSFSSMAQEQPAKKKGPRIFMVAEEYFNFGNVPEGPELKHKFVFVNGGDEPLIIKDVINSTTYCNAEWTKGPIAPGETGYVIEYVNTTVVYGKFYRWFFIASNAGNWNCALGYKLRVRGNIIKKNT